MYFQTTFPQNPAADSNLNQRTHTEEGNFSGVHIPEIAISLGGYIGFVMAWVVFFMMLSKLRTVVDNKMVFKINNLPKLPCQNCQFFSTNNYLKCAVQPSMVMTEEAINCSDYSPKNAKF